jgi:hypothetical protein
MGVLPAMLAIFFHFQAIFQKLLILSGKIIDFFAFSAFEFDHVVLRHNISDYSFYSLKALIIVVILGIFA